MEIILVIDKKLNVLTFSIIHIHIFNPENFREVPETAAIATSTVVSYAYANVETKIETSFVFDDTQTEYEQITYQPTALKTLVIEYVELPTDTSIQNIIYKDLTTTYMMNNRQKETYNAESVPIVEFLTTSTDVLSTDIFPIDQTSFFETKQGDIEQTDTYIIGTTGQFADGMNEINITESSNSLSFGEKDIYMNGSSEGKAFKSIYNHKPSLMYSVLNI